MIQELIQLKREGRIWQKVPAGILLYILNLLLAADFAIAAIFGSDPRLSVSALLGIRLKKNPQHLILSKLPSIVKEHIEESSSWWNHDYPPVNRSIWT